MFLQNDPIIWHLKKQNTVESSSFGSEFIALHVAQDMIMSLCYKLHMFRVPLNGPAAVFCDNQGVVKNASLPDSALAKRHNAINYNIVWELAVAGILCMGKEDGSTNLADALSKILPLKRWYDLFSQMAYSPMFQDKGSGLRRDPTPHQLADGDTRECSKKEPRLIS